MPLRILVIITLGEPGGAQVHVRDLVCGLCDRIDFHVAVGDDGFLAEQVRRAGVPVSVIPELRRSISPAADGGALRALHTLITRVAPDLVHTHSSKAGVLGRLAAHAAGVPAVHTAHAWSFSDGLPWARKALAIPVEALAARWTRGFIAVSEADREIALRYGVARAGQVQVVHNGVSDRSERAHPDRGGTPIVTMVARLAPPKDHVLLLHALARIDAPFSLRFVGDGPDRARIVAVADRLGVGPRLELLGVRADVPALLATSHVFALISRQEGFPLAVLEAMRAGLPVVASDVGGVSEAVIPGKTGVLVDRGDEAGLRAALERLLTTPALRRTMGDAGRRAYEGRFTVDRMLARTAAIYEEMALGPVAGVA